MSNKKQTAVDLLYQRAISVLPMGAIDARLKIEETYHQAKAMEKERIKKAFDDGKWDSMALNGTPKEQYYKDTYE